MDENITQPQQSSERADEQQQFRTDSIGPDGVAVEEVALEGTGEEDSGGAPLVAPLDFMAVIGRDVRAAHFLVDVISGRDVDDAVERNFAPRRAEPDASTLEEAERRGYLRGRNEGARAVMDRPGAYEEVRPPEPDGHSGQPAPSLTSFARTSVWDIE